MTPRTNTTVLPPSLVEMATRHVRSEVLSGALEPGERIVEETLCARLGISRAPVREALRLLAQEGLVEHLPRRGFRVLVWSATDILQLFELRRVLERHAIESALPLPAGGDPFAAVRAALEEMRAADAEGWTLERDDAHRRFHAEIVALAGNRQLDLAYAPILLKLQLPMARNLREEARVADRRDGVRRHTELLEALETNDPAVACAALRRHGELAYLALDIC
ncbi:GntR family transcriptional regulator [Nocardia bovistercoris]|uniref:GntR family transcriptional regulator n=1 Tax=Nocardia bovistercoris TaxID=2785916 RepID=A0A931IAA6_9NOCA|nr:GntR family transcriptional regulator [Nocardia bovistercoris]MBH0776552.1 GntR family transcriptional regulator [Nocardia bovistercoris]